jgi:predicted ABC-type ATPase
MIFLSRLGVRRRFRNVITNRHKPLLIVFGGPNGSGKSTITQAFQDAGLLPAMYINPDEIAIEKGLDGYAAADIADTLRAFSLNRQESFSFETVMSQKDKVVFMVKAKDCGFRVQLVFVTTQDPEVNINRVENRKLLGGHYIAPDKVRERYKRSMELLPEALEMADTAVIYDNSAEGAENSMVVAKKFDDGTIEVYANVAGQFWIEWFRENIKVGRFVIQ